MKLSTWQTIITHRERHDEEKRVECLKALEAHTGKAAEDDIIELLDPMWVVTPYRKIFPEDDIGRWCARDDNWRWLHCFQLPEYYIAWRPEKTADWLLLLKETRNGD